MESFGVLGPPDKFNHIYSYQTSETYCIGIQLRPPYESGRAGTEIHKITSDWDSRKGVDELTPNDMMIKFTERSLEVCKRGGSSAWHMIQGLHGPTFQQLCPEKCYWTMTRHGGRYWLISIELVKKTPGKLWSRLMRDERESNRPSMKWDKDMQKAPMLMDKSGNFWPSTFCPPLSQPRYEGQDDLEALVAGDLPQLEDGAPGAWLPCRASDLMMGSFDLEESTQKIVVSMELVGERWRALQRAWAQRGDSADTAAFVLEVPFGGQHITFSLVGDEDAPVLKGGLGGCVWRKGVRWFVEIKNGKPIVELELPKQTPEPWSYIVEGYYQLSRSSKDPVHQMVLDGLWDEEAVSEKAKGDEYFRNGEYRAAVQCYSRALERNPDSYVTLTNRAAATLAFEGEKFRLDEVLEDARRSLEINPEWHKGKFREGIALCKLHRHDEALFALEAGQRLDKSAHEGWEEEIVKVKEERIRWNNRKKLSYLNDVE